ncbi:MAG TPA: DUF2269 family protein [Solirubrobacterales bacterium]|jgi:uncharacterized membrane protein|nr:DUF2269 family protein [Solirubrobacterales bacterium]
MLPLADITDYSVGLFIHILAAVVAFGPTFGYGLLFSATGKYPQATPAIFEGIRKVDRFLLEPGMIVLLLAGIYLMSEGNWDASEAFIAVGFIAIILLFGLQHAFFRPQGQKAQTLAERDLRAGNTLSEEFQEIARRLSIIGPLTGLIVVVTIFFMVTKP